MRRRRFRKIVTVKMQRPLFSNGNMAEVMTYIVGDDDEQLSNADLSVMPPEYIDEIFGGCYKVYYLGWYEKGKPVRLFQPTRQEEWV